MADSAQHIFPWPVGITGACLSGLIEVITPWEGLGHLLLSLALASWGAGPFAFILFLYIAVITPIA